MSGLQQVMVPRAFFQREKMSYANWRWAFIREIVQNSYDAGATLIQFFVSASLTTGNTTLKVVDNGRGMNRRVVESVLLCMGGSLKSDGAVGGFGVAKTLLYFGNVSYRILTGTLEVAGAGGQYSITQDDSKPAVRGVTSVIEFDDYSCDDLRANIRNYVGESYLGYFSGNEVEVELDGQPVASDTTEFEDYADSELGELYFSDTSDSRNMLMVTLNGLPMFAMRSWNSDQGGVKATLAINGNYSMFTSNRDSLVEAHRDALNRIFHRLTTERNAMRAGSEETMHLVMGAKNVTVTAVDRDKVAARTTVESDGDAVLPADPVNQLCGQVDWSKYHEDFSLRFAYTTKKRRTNAKDKAVLSVGEIARHLNLKRTAKLAYLWNEQVKELLGLPMLADRFTVRTGLLYTKQPILGLCVTRVDGSYDILMNALQLRSDWIDADILDLAIHEVAHTLVSDHNERFIDAMDRIRAEYNRS